MKILFYLGHPAHWHLFKNLIKLLDSNNIKFQLLIKTKDLLEELVMESGYDYTNIYIDTRKDSYTGLLSAFIEKQVLLIKHHKIFNPDLIMSTTADASVLGKISGTPTLIFNDDDVSVVPYFSMLAGPTASVFVAPKTCDMGRWKYKTLAYTGHQKMAYLHPTVFSPRKEIVEKYIDPESSYFILRLVKLKAHHDKRINGITNELAENVINILESHGKVLISSERNLPKPIRPYKLNIKPSHVHHIMFFANAMIGDTQSMVVESAMLGVPSFRFNDFAGRIGVLESLEQDYRLVKSFKTSQKQEFINSLKVFIDSYKDEEFKERHRSLVQNSANLYAFMKWFVNEYPLSLRICKNDNTIIENFIDCNY